MQKILIPAAAAVVLGLAPLAASAHTRMYGEFSDAVVKSVNQSALTVTIEGGETFNLGYAGEMAQLQPGAHVALTWQDINGSPTVTKVSSAS